MINSKIANSSLKGYMDFEFDNCGGIEEVPIVTLDAASGKSESLVKIPCVEFLVF